MKYGNNELMRGDVNKHPGQSQSPLSGRSSDIFNNSAKKPNHLGVKQDSEQDKFWRKVIDDDTRRYRIEKERT